jgi:hypothetical protein
MKKENTSAAANQYHDSRETLLVLLLGAGIALVILLCL